MNSKEVKKRVKAYFLIVNLVFAVVAFSWMVGAEVPSATLPVRNPPTSTTTQTSTLDIFKSLGQAFLKAVEQNPLPTTPTPTEVPAVINLENVDPSSESGISLAKISPIYKVPPNTIFHPETGKEVLSLWKDSEGKFHLMENGKMGNVVQLPEGVDSSTFTQGGIDHPAIEVGVHSILENAISIGMMFGLGTLIGGFIGGNADISLGTALAAVTFIGQAQAGDWTGTFLEGPADVASKMGEFLDILGPGSGGVIIGAIIFVVMYKKASQEKVEFNCLPYQPPIGGGDCEKCNIFGECSEYRCKSLGQACELLNAGTEDEKCTWVNPRDVNSPMIKVEHVLSGYKWVPDTAVRPPATGVVISQIDGTCVEAFTALEFTLLTNEPSQCKIDYNLTHSFDEMSYYIGGSNLFSYNHTEEMSLPGPDAINAIAPELQNDGTYTLYARCQDANGNFNQDAFSVRFCVKPGPDTTPPRIEAVNVPSNSPINYEQTSLALEVYVNEPAECKWSKTDTSFDNMETSMVCDTNLWEMNNQNVYTCRTTLTGIQDRKENSYYFKCKDQPNEVEGNRNVNTQSYLYNIVGTQPLNILSIGPNETIKGSTDTIPVLLVVRTDNGYKNGEAICYYYNDANNNAPVNNEDYIEFLETGENAHEQRQDLDSGAYTYYYKCVDLGGNTAYDSTSFNVEVDRQAPVVVRAYKSSGELKIITNEKAECAYSNKDCNFDIDEGIQMTTLDNEAHNSEWKTTKNYYVRCKDEYDNQPPLNVGAVGCSIVVRPYEIMANEGVIEL